MKEELIYGRHGTERMTVEELNPHLKIFHQLLEQQEDMLRQ